MKSLFQLFVKHVIVSPNPLFAMLSLIYIYNKIQNYIDNPNANAPHAEQEQGLGQQPNALNRFEDFNAFHNNYNVFEYLR
jgi:hypothetical protein